MISVTDRAKDLLYGVLEEAEQHAGIGGHDVGIRLAPSSMSEDGPSSQIELGLGLDVSHEGDQVVEHHGKKILLVDESTGEFLDGAMIDAVETPEGQRLTINPKAA